MLMRADALVGPEGSTPREWRATFLRRDKARVAVRRGIAWKPEHLVIAHGRCVMNASDEAMRRSFSWLSP